MLQKSNFMACSIIKIYCLGLIFFCRSWECAIWFLRINKKLQSWYFVSTFQIKYWNISIDNLKSASSVFNGKEHLLRKYLLANSLTLNASISFHFRNIYKSVDFICLYVTHSLIWFTARFSPISLFMPKKPWTKLPS